jgi:hypothetical protein
MLDILILLTAICGDLYTALLNKSLLLTQKSRIMKLVRYANKRVEYSKHKFDTEFLKTNAMDQDSIGLVDPDTDLDQEWQKQPLKKGGN